MRKLKKLYEKSLAKNNSHPFRETNHPAPNHCSAPSPLLCSAPPPPFREFTPPVE